MDGVALDTKSRSRQELVNLEMSWRAYSQLQIPYHNQQRNLIIFLCHDDIFDSNLCLPHNDIIRTHVHNII